MAAVRSNSLSLTEILVLGATVVGGLFGSEIDRALIATPAWRHLDVQAWAEYSRHADLGTGAIVYPIFAGALLILILGAVVAYRLDPTAPRAARMPIHASALLAIAMVVCTFVAVPIMHNVGSLPDADTSALHRSFETFTVWGVYTRSACMSLSFVCTVWSLVALLRHRPVA